MPTDRPFARFGAVAIQDTYPDAVTRAGGIAAVLTPCNLDDDDADAAVATLKALVLSGGPDLDPSLYRQPPHPNLYEVSALQDRFELALLRAAMRAHTPLLCICRGMQLLNVAQGGTLHQHLGDLEGVGPHGVPNGGGATRNEISIDPDSRLAAVVETTSLIGECHHHQVVDEVGEGLRVVARTTDDMVEALEWSNCSDWMVAVQWHPEDSAGSDHLQQRIFERLIAATAR